ncbi:MAG: hypothetical protein ACRC9L_00030 [Brevinema sp.]
MNMHKWLIRAMLLMGYCIPFAFLSIYGDATYDTMLLYCLMIVGFGGLCFSAIKYKQFLVVIIGNAFSVASSYICVQLFYTEEWGWYFKPFTANILIFIISIIAFLIQLCFMIHSHKQQRTK